MIHLVNKKPISNSYIHTHTMTAQYTSARSRTVRNIIVERQLKSVENKVVDAPQYLFMDEDPTKEACQRLEEYGYKQEYMREFKFNDTSDTTLTQYDKGWFSGLITGFVCCICLMLVLVMITSIKPKK